MLYGIVLVVLAAGSVGDSVNYFFDAGGVVVLVVAICHIPAGAFSEVQHSVCGVKGVIGGKIVDLICDLDYIPPGIIVIGLLEGIIVTDSL